MLNSTEHKISTALKNYIAEKESYFMLLSSDMILSGIPSECQTVWIKTRPNICQPDIGPICLQELLVGKEVNVHVFFVNSYMNL